MKKFTLNTESLLICFLFTCFVSLNAQTKVFSIGPDGTIDKHRYRYFEHSSGTIYLCNNCKDDTKDMDVFKNAKVVLAKNQIALFVDKIVTPNETTSSIIAENKDKLVDLGYLSDSKKIVSTENGKPTAIQKGGYIKDHKIYDATNKMIGSIEGEEIYGAVWYLMGL